MNFLKDTNYRLSSTLTDNSNISLCMWILCPIPNRCRKQMELVYYHSVDLKESVVRFVFQIFSLKLRGVAFPEVVFRETTKLSMGEQY